jgi:signal transduction histidine kinase
MARVLAAGADAEADGVDVLQFRDGRAFEGFSRPRRVDGRTVGRVWSFHDITERRALEEQLRQSQKMEAVGRLAGGVAHDFNNVLTVLKFHADFLQEAALPPELAENVAEIGVAASHAADLTRQLLAFSRKQVLRPVVLEVDAVVANLQPMLRRLLGEDVRLVARRAPVGPVLADRGQLEQVLVNLVVNSRDAMPDGGTITVRTGPVTIDARDPHARARTLAPGTYLALSVTDTGQGIPPEVLDRVFEPFFTTKELGKGSGLGLSTVYGIVRQSGGAVDVVSELGRGTVVRVLLPLAPAAARPDPAEAPRKPGMGTETVLLVEDETTLRRLGRKVLERSGYTVLEACDGGDAVEVAARFAGRIDLLVTDVVMPTMHGRQVAECLRKARGELRVLFMSGYTDDEVLRRGALGAGTAFLQKPFTPAEFADAVRDVLDSPLPSLPGASGGAALPGTHAAAGH